MTIDFGSENGKLTLQFVPAGKHPKDVPPAKVSLLGLAQSHIELVCIYDDDYNLILGRAAVSEWLKSHPEEANQVVEQLKLALCPEYQDCTAVERIYDALGSEKGDLANIQRTVVDILRIFKRKGLQHVRRLRRMTSDSLDDVMVELQLTVPVVWPGFARGLMSNAARQAGYDRTVLRSEPECAAAAYIYEYWPQGLYQVCMN
jgi:molecular chaperone DnaK (HSP70)